METKNTALKNTQLKTELRKAFKQKRDRFYAQADHAQLQQELAQNLTKALPKDCQSYWASYCSTQSEVDVTGACHALNLRWCYPVVTKDHLEFFEPKGEWTKNQFQIQEPNAQTSRKVALSEIEGMLVPGIAFDLKGHRLGRGKAYYDKTLQDFSGIKIGIAYSVQVTESLPFDSHDISMDMIVTEKEIFKI